MLVTGLLGPMMTVSSLSKRSQESLAGEGLFQSGEGHGFDPRPSLEARPKVLKVHHPLRSADNRGYDVIGHGDHPLHDPEALAMASVVRLSLTPRAEEIGAKYVHCPVLVPNGRSFLVHPIIEEEGRG